MVVALGPVCVVRDQKPPAGHVWLRRPGIMVSLRRAEAIQGLEKHQGPANNVDHGRGARQTRCVSKLVQQLK